MKIKIRNSLFFIFSNLLIFLLLESVFTIFFIYKTSHHGFMSKIFIGDTDKKNEIITFKIKWNKSTNKMEPGVYNIKGNKIKINSKGFIGEEFSIENKKNCRIISLGSSTTASIEAKSYPEILEKKFKKNNINCEVLNFGFDGVGLNFIESLLVNEAINYNPNIVILTINRNATLYNSYGNSSVSPDVIENKFDFLIYKVKKFLFSNVMTYRFIQLSFKRIVSKFYDTENKIVNPYNPKSFHLKNFFTSKYINQMTNIFNFCTSKGIKVAFIKQGHYFDPVYQKSLELLPNEKIIEKLSSYDKKSESDLDKLGLKKDDLFWIYSNLILNNALEKIKMENDDLIIVDPIDRLFSFKKEKNFIDEGLHLNAHGNEIIADEVFKSLIKSINFPLN